MVQSIAKKSSPREDRPASGQPVSKRMLNVPLLTGTLIAAAVLCPAAYAWHAFQLKRTAKAFLDRAERLEEDGDMTLAAGYLHRYLQLKPEDIDVRVHLAKTFDRAAEQSGAIPRAIELYYLALGRGDAKLDRNTVSDLRRRLTELLLELAPYPEQAARWMSAEEEAKKLSADDPHGWRLLARALYGEFQFGMLAKRRAGHRDESVDGGESPWQGRTIGKAFQGEGGTVDKAFERALKLNPKDTALAVTLAQIYRDHEELLSDEKQLLKQPDRERLADEFVDQMVAANPKDPAAYLARYHYRTQYGLPGAEDDLKAALEHGPDNLPVLLAAGEHARQAAVRRQRTVTASDEAAQRYAEARRHFERAIQVAPSHEGAYLGLGQVCLDQGEVQRAIEAWQRGLQEGNRESVLLNMRLAEILIEQGQLDRAKKDPSNPQADEKPLDVVHRVIEDRLKKKWFERARSSLLSLKRSKDLLRAKWHLGKWLTEKGDHLQKAIPLLRDVATRQKSWGSEVGEALEAWLLLAHAYAASDQWEQAAVAYQEAVRLQPKMVSLRVQAADGLLRAGQPERAARYCERVLAIDDLAIAEAGKRPLTDAQRAETWLLLARARFNLAKSAQDNNGHWEPFQTALKAVRASANSGHLAEPWRLTLLEAELIAARPRQQPESAQELPDARKLLRQAENEYPDSRGLFQELASVYKRLGYAQDADRVSKYASVQASLRKGDLEAARQQLVKLHQEYPSHLGFLRGLSEFAFLASDFEAAKSWEDKLRAVEGPNGFYAGYCEARRLLAEAKVAGDPGLARAAELQQQLQDRRPTWPPIHRLRGAILERQGRLEQAIEAYQEAIKLGDRRIDLYQRVIRLLNDTQRFTEADQYLSRLKNLVPSSRSLSWLEISAARRRGQMDRAIQTARRGVDRRPKDPMAWLWLGQLLLVAEQKTEAEAAFQQAVQLAPADVRTHNGLFTYYLSTKQPDRARETLKQLTEKVQLSAAQRAYVLAQGYERLEDRQNAETNYAEAARLEPENLTFQASLFAYYMRTEQTDLAREKLRELVKNDKLSVTQQASVLAEGYERLGDREDAEAAYREAVRLDPENVALRIRLVDFLWRGNDDLGAEKELRLLLQQAPESGVAQRKLAVILATRGGQQELSEAERLLGHSGPDTEGSAENQRTLARLLVRRGGKENLGKARRILETLVANSRETIAGDRVLLAQLFENEGDLEAARQQYDVLVSQASSNATYLALYTDFLLRNDFSEDADTWLRKLEETSPDSLAAVGLRARWLYGQRRTSEIESLVEPAAKAQLEKLKENAQKAQLCLSIGNLYSRLKQHPAAGDWYRRLAELLPDQYGPMAMCLVRQGRIGDAIRLCKDAAKSDNSARPAITLSAALTAGKPTMEDFQLAEPLFAKAIEDHSDSAALFFNLGNVRLMQKRGPEAVELYRKALELDARHVPALNNLATLLSEQLGKAKEAHQYIDRAIEIAGSQSWLLDTKGMALVFEGKPKQAVPLLQTAASARNPDPRFPFHLAVAYARVGELEKARGALKKARDGDLAGQILTQTDQKLLTELEQELR